MPPSRGSTSPEHVVSRRPSVSRGPPSSSGRLWSSGDASSASPSGDPGCAQSGPRRRGPTGHVVRAAGGGGPVVAAAGQGPVVPAAVGLGAVVVSAEGGEVLGVGLVGWSAVVERGEGIYVVEV